MSPLPNLILFFHLLRAETNSCCDHLTSVSSLFHFLFSPLKMEPLSAAAGALTVLSATGWCIKHLKKAHKTMRCAEKEVGDAIFRAQNLEYHANMWRVAIQKASSLTNCCFNRSDIRSLDENLRNDGRHLKHKLRSLLEPTQPLWNETPFRGSKFLAKVRWCFIKDEFLRLLAFMHCLETSMTLTCSIVHLTVLLSKPPTPELAREV